MANGFCTNRELRVLPGPGDPGSDGAFEPKEMQSLVDNQFDVLPVSARHSRPDLSCLAAARFPLLMQRHGACMDADAHHGVVCPPSSPLFCFAAVGSHGRVPRALRRQQRLGKLTSRWAADVGGLRQRHDSATTGRYAS